MKILEKILLGYLLLTLIFSIGVFVCLQTLGPVERSFERLADENLAVLNLIHTIRTQGNLLHAEQIKIVYMLSLESSRSIEKTLRADLVELSRTRRQLLEDLGEYGRLVELYFPDEIEYIPSLQMSIEQLLGVVGQVEKMAREMTDPVLPIPISRFEEVEERFLAVTAEIVSHELHEIRERREQVNRAVHGARSRIGLAYLLSLGFSLLLAILLARRVAGPIRKLAAAVEDFGSGSQPFPLIVNNSDEIGQLTLSFNQMAAQIEKQRTQQDDRLAQKSASLSSVEYEFEQQRLQLQQIEQQLAQMQKMEAIGTLAGGIAHDFNNILSGIIGYTQMAQRKLGSEHPVHAYLSAVNDAGQRAANLTRQILEFSRQSEHQLVVLQLQPIIEEVLTLLRASLPSTIGILFESSPEAEQACTMADPTQIHQIIMNLCANARHAMREKGGLLTIDLSVQRIAARADDLSVVKLSSGDYLQLILSDTGHGIAPENLDRIFEPYFTTKQRGEGTGMGLSVVHGIVLKYGGQITASSRLDQGASFRILLPVISGLQQDLPADDEFKSGTERLLLVDDDQLGADMLESLLSDMGYQVITERDGYAAWNRFEQQPDDFDLLITDMTMPGMTGAELAERVLRVKPQLPIILCTGFSDRINRQQAYQAGIKAFATKPLSLAELTKLIRQLLDEEENVEKD
ncbi:MAG: response regulator [Geopsychrobacter sp.]|nr:response regulator [Geopsychrobacter sp.]